jgi:predicted lysophospholipase L1 biosynthesis ABC-type transport system permease subunit
MGDNSSNSFISINGAPPGPILAYFLRVTPGWINVMNIRLVAGRDLWASDTSPGNALINEAFAKQFFKGENPIGKVFNRGESRFTVVGLVGNVPYRNLREPTLPQVYVPFRTSQAEGTAQPIGEATFILRTALANPLALASLVRKEVPHARPEFRVSNVRTQSEINDSHAMRERLLAKLAAFFAVVAVLLSAIGIYGMLDYTVAQRRREIGIRIALGARSGTIVKDITLSLSLVVILGAMTGLTLGLASASFLQTLFYQVKATDLSMVLLPFTILFASTLIAALRPVIRAIRIDPVRMLRAE